uniref:Saposin B-type domain-containing protein n=1 Tax=Periophthalmus magnuspinnatus TaxID=409849 RepID=A0A3B4A8D8_9GOBI
MNRSSLVVLCVLLSCSGETLILFLLSRLCSYILMLPGVCWACKWALNKIKKKMGNNATAEVIKSKLLSICNQIGLIKSLCQKFVQKNLEVLIEELTTTDDVRSICVNVKACKSVSIYTYTHTAFCNKNVNNLIFVSH